VLVDTNGDAGKELADAGVGTFVPADVTSETEARAAVDQATALGPLRVLVNCAGVGWGARIVDKSGTPHDLALFRQIRPR
jgi:NAD(P)-dependent dehydrogenase (short-subunit alcohol dehydrogenase family)